jgi:hypothetical protein
VGHSSFDSAYGLAQDTIRLARSARESNGGGAGSCTRVRKYIPAGIYNAYPLLICRPRREEAARTAGSQPRKISLTPSRTTSISQPA